MKKYLILLSLYFLIFIHTGCDISKKPATGFEDEIYVIADSVEFDELKSSLQKAFEVQINTPLPEKLFTLKRISSNSIGLRI